jgi:glucose/arabinose dehydrogenase
MLHERARRTSRVVCAVALSAVITGTCAASARGAGTPFRAIAVVSGLHEPVDVAFSPNDSASMYVVERGGLIRRVVGGRADSTPFLDIRSAISTAGSERGLLSMVFDPGYESNKAFYVQYASKGGSIQVARYVVRNGLGDPSSRSVLLTMPEQRLWPGGPQSLYHNGGELAFGTDSALYASVGDGGYWRTSGKPCRPRVKCPLSPDPHGNAQNLSVLRGKLIRLDIFDSSAAPTVVAYGLRNPWRYSFDRETGDTYIGDVGWNRAEEIDLIPSSSVTALTNFGWSVYEGRSKRPGGAARVNPGGTLAGPLYAYGHEHGDCSITGGYVYRGSTVPSMAGRYIFGDFCSGRVWSIRPVAGRATDLRLEPLKIPALDSFAEDQSGELYAVSFKGRVFALR